MMPAIDKKPCPFCGEKIILHLKDDIRDVRDVHWVYCTSCRAEGPLASSWDKAQELWNIRLGVV